MYHHARLIFVFLVETGFHHVGQDGLDLVIRPPWPPKVRERLRLADILFNLLLFVTPFFPAQLMS